METHDAVVIVNMVTMHVAEEPRCRPNGT